jgi:hypothetical protein
MQLKYRSITTENKIGDIGKKIVKLFNTGQKRKGQEMKMTEISPG